MTITESQIRESIEKNMDSFREKALNGNLKGQDVANLFGYGNMFSEGEELEKEFESLRDEVVSEMEKQETLREHGEIISEADVVPPEESEGAEESEGDDAETNEEPKKTDNDKGTKGEKEDDKEKEEKERGPLKPGETTHLESFEELFNETGVKIEIKQQGTDPEPSPLFGQSSAKHNKYRVTLRNDKGGDLSWIYWDSEKNTNDGIVPNTEVVMKDFGLKLNAILEGNSPEKFKKDFGYDEIDSGLAQKQYEGLVKIKNRINKIFPDQHNVYQLVQLAKKM